MGKQSDCPKHSLSVIHLYIPSGMFCKGEEHSAALQEEQGLSLEGAVLAWVALSSQDWHSSAAQAVSAVGETCV